jgi:hypothetical protein
MGKRRETGENMPLWGVIFLTIFHSGFLSRGKFCSSEGGWGEGLGGAVLVLRTRKYLFRIRLF